MEQQENKTELEQAYRTQREQEMPDLWDRIEQGFEEEAKQMQRKKHRIHVQYMVLAAAVFLAIVIAVPVLMSDRTKSDEPVRTEESVQNIVMENTQAEADYDAEEYAETAAESADAATEYSEEDSVVQSGAAYDADGMENGMDSGEYMYLLAGNDVIPDGSYDAVQCIFLQEVDADGEYGKWIYVDLDAPEGSEARKLLAEYAILEWESSEIGKADHVSYLLGVGMEDGTIVTRSYTENADYASHTFSKFAESLFELKK